MRSLQQHAELRFFGKLLLKIITIEIRKKKIIIIIIMIWFDEFYRALICLLFFNQYLIDYEK